MILFIHGAHGGHGFFIHGGHGGHGSSDFIHVAHGGHGFFLVATLEIFGGNLFKDVADARNEIPIN